MPQNTTSQSSESELDADNSSTTGFKKEFNEKDIVRKNIDVWSGVKSRFEEIARENSIINSISVPSILRQALLRTVTFGWLSLHDGGTFTIIFPGNPPTVFVDEFGLKSVRLKHLNLSDKGLQDRERVNLSMPKVLLDELDEIATQHDKALTTLMRESFHLELLLYQLRDQGGEAFITLKSGARCEVVRNYHLFNPSPKELLRQEQLEEARKRASLEKQQEQDSSIEESEIINI